MPPPTLTLTLTFLCYVVGALGYGYHNKVGPGGETTHLGLFSILDIQAPTLTLTLTLTSREPER